MRHTTTTNRAALASRARRITRARRERMETRQQLAPMQQFLNARVAGGKLSRSKVPINEETAMQISAVFAAVRILAGIRSTLPLRVLEEQQGQDPEVKLHPVRALLGERNGEPNPYQTPAVLQAHRESHRALWGNSYTEIVPDLGTGQPAALVGHHPTAVTPFLDPELRDRAGFARLFYRVVDADGARTLPASQMAHVPNLGYDGIIGRSTIELGREPMGTAKAQDNLAATFYGNSNRPFMIVTTADYLDDPQFERLNREINEEYMGDDAFGSLLLEGGAKAEFATMKFSDAQFLEMKRRTSTEIATGFFGLPPHLAGDLENAHYDNLDEQDRALVLYTLAPLLIRDEQELGRKLLTRSERGRGLYLKYDTDALLRGDRKSRYEAHRSALMTGWRTINEVRALEDLAPLPGGDELAKPAAIYGKPGGGSPEKKPPAVSIEGGRPAAGDESEPRDDARRQLRELTAAVLDGLQRHEVIQLERMAGRSDFETRAREFYAGHAGKLTDRLQAIPEAADIVTRHVDQHLGDVLLSLIDPNPADALRACLAGWADDPTRLAGELVQTDEGTR